MVIILSDIPTVVMSLLGVAFGILAFVWILTARKRLAGGSIKRYLTISAIALLFLMLASSWHAIAVLTNIHHNFGEITTLPHHILMIFAYLVFILGAFQMLYISREFSFEEQVPVMKKALSEGKKKK